MTAERPPVDRKARLNAVPPSPELRSVADRVQDFEPALVDLTPEQAQAIASVCIHCPDPAPCQKACPAGNDISEALWLIEEGDFLAAAEVYRRTSTLPEICGRVCPHEDLCQGACVRNKRGLPVYTGQLEAFVSDFARAHNGEARPQAKKPENGWRSWGPALRAWPAPRGCARLDTRSRSSTRTRPPAGCFATGSLTSSSRSRSSSAVFRTCSMSASSSSWRPRSARHLPSMTCSRVALTRSIWRSGPGRIRA